VTSGSEQRQLGVELFNEAWRLMESREDDDRLLLVAYASAYHWSMAPECTPANRARSEWQLSRVYVVLGRGEPALWHAHRCLALCEENGIGDWDLAYAYEALARAAVLAGEPSAHAWREKARAAGDAIADSEDREHFDEDYATL
jgi:hypothetical protein